MRLTKEWLDKILKEDPEKRIVGGWETLKDSPRNKLHAITTKVDGYKFDSGLEARRYKVLKLWEQAKVITNLDLEHKLIGAKNVEKALKHRWILQESFTDETGKKHRAITYTDDFQYMIGNLLIVEDLKGMATNEFKRSTKLLLHRYPYVKFFVNRNINGWYFD